LRAAQASLSPQVAADVALLFEDPRFLMDEATGGDATWLARFVDYWNEPGTWASMTDKAKFMAQMVGWKMFQEVRAVSTEAKAFEQYALQVPLTLVHGEKTTAPAADMVRRLAQVNAHAHVEVLSGAGHMGVLHAPEAVRATLREHWSRLPSV
jgi:pimeloyl-ACP methyl ester carboxylesterase